MPRPTTGTIHTHFLIDGTRAFHLRVPFEGERVRVVLHEIDGCACGCGGGWDEPAARTELGNILARIRVGVWKPPVPVVEPRVTFGVRRYFQVPRLRALLALSVAVAAVSAMVIINTVVIVRAVSVVRTPTLRSRWRRWASARSLRPWPCRACSAGLETERSCWPVEWR